MHFSLVKIRPREAFSSDAFDDVILPVYYALSDLGFEAEMLVNEVNPHSRNIFFGTNMLQGPQRLRLPKGSILFNLEQFTAGSRWTNEDYARQLTLYPVWDYSPRNIAYMKERHGIEAALVRLGYVPEMTRLVREFPRDIDVLFYGTMNERRNRVIEGLQAAGVKVCMLNWLFGRARDQAIARARLILNVHYYTPASLEVARLGYVLANRRAVVSERGPETEVYPELDTACAFCAYEHLVPTVRRLLADAAERDKVAEQGFAGFSSLRLADSLRAVVGRRKVRGTGMDAAAAPLPRHLHAGSGKDFRPEALNVDIMPHCNPDLLLDLSLPLEPGTAYPTSRFGNIALEPGYFSRITAFELLEHVHDLSQLMSNFLSLLREGGELHISVPHELSLGAWQDPTHVRAFNEASWQYYTNWAWYMNWREYRFEQISLEYVLSDYGESLKKQGAPHLNLLYTPRAVDGMRVVLRKRKSTPEELAEYDAQFGRLYERPAGVWAVQLWSK